MFLTELGSAGLWARLGCALSAAERETPGLHLLEVHLRRLTSPMDCCVVYLIGARPAPKHIVPSAETIRDWSHLRYSGFGPLDYSDRVRQLLAIGSNLQDIT